MHAEGGISDEMRRAFAEARLIEQFIPLRSFDVPFSPNTAETAVQYPHSQDKLVRYAQSYSLVEVCYTPFVEFLPLMEITPPPHVAAWTARILARPSAQATKPAR